MELRQMEYFLAACRNMSISRAAQELFVTQPAVSMSIKRLENELGVELYDRRYREFFLTDAGEIFRQSAEHILAEIENLEKSIRHLALYQNMLEVAVPSISCCCIYPLLYDDFHAAYPEVKIRIRDMVSPAVIAAVDRGDIELGFCIRPTRLPEGMEFLSFTTGTIKVLVPSGNPLAKYDKLPVDKLLNEQLLFCRPSDMHVETFTESLVRAAFEHEGLKMPQPLYFDDNHTLLYMVSAGYGLYCVGDTASNIFQGRSDLIAMDFEKPVEFEIGLVYKDGPLSPTAQLFIPWFSDLPYRSR